MKYKDLLMCAAVWMGCASTLQAFDILSLPFEPRDLTEFEHRRYELTRMGPKFNTEPPHKIRKKVTSSPYYKKIHPTIKSWIDQNEERYFKEYHVNYVLYLSKERGIKIIMKQNEGYKFFLHRTHWFDGDAAWEYEKEPAINPATNKPWIHLSDREMKAVMRGAKQKLSDEDKQLLKDVLAIVNENFHYMYGMKLVDLGRDVTLDKEKLIGKFIPYKFPLFEEHLDNLDLSAYTPQQIRLYRALGHPIYSYDGLIDSEKHNFWSSTCGGKGLTPFTLKSGYEISLIAFFNSVNPDDVNPSYGARAYQIHNIPIIFELMMKGFEKVLQENGADARSVSANKTPLARALYLVYRKTKKYTEAVATHEYVIESDNDFIVFEKDVTRLSDVVPLPGVKTRVKKIKTPRKRRQRR